MSPFYLGETIFDAQRAPFLDTLLLEASDHYSSREEAPRGRLSATRNIETFRKRSASGRCGTAAR